MTEFHKATVDKLTLIQTQQFLDWKDIQRMYQCGRNKALSLIRSIKSVSDIAELQGKVTISDYEAWYNQSPKKEA